ncbi:hypothetical protein LMIY3S_00809 [Labrys miyagiensis]
MPRQYLLRTGLAALLVLGSLAGSVSSSFSATTGPGAGNSGSRGSSNPGGGNGGNGGGFGGGSGAGMPDAVRVVAPNDCTPGAAACQRRPPRVFRPSVKTVEQTRCSNYWRLVELDDGSIIEDRTQPMRKHCRVIRTFD